MGLTKQAEIERQDRFNANRDVAEEILVRAGILQRCGSCDEVIDSSDWVHPGTDLTEAYRIASAMFRDGDEIVQGYERRAVLDTMKALCEECPSECLCMRRRDD